MRGPVQGTERWRAPSHFLSRVLVCPKCRGSLTFGERRIACRHCGSQFEQRDPRVIDLLPPDLASRDRSRWRERQEEMTRAYEELLTDRDHTILGYRNDYTPCAPLLANYSGRILDLGGGRGITRHFLSPEVEYVVLEPSLEWMDPQWQTLAVEFPCLAGPLDFVRGVAEYLPFGDEAFDVVLLLWSLNHVSVPQAALREVARVLRRQGRVLLVLEDMPPRWRDFLEGSYPHDRTHLGHALAQKIRSVLLGWPIQSDHVRIRERELLRWAGPDLEVGLRAWLGAYLTFELVKKDTVS
jgi:SAM-dependent methyltransferase